MTNQAIIDRLSQVGAQIYLREPDDGQHEEVRATIWHQATMNGERFTLSLFYPGRITNKVKMSSFKMAQGAVRAAAKAGATREV